VLRGKSTKANTKANIWCPALSNGWVQGFGVASATGPKELIILDGSAHAQFLFDTDQGEHLMREILRFLSEP